MIYNEKITESYGKFPEVSGRIVPIGQKNKPIEDNYNSGYMPRFFIKKANENKIFEITSQYISGINTNLYKVVSIKWKISGPKNNIYKNGILDKSGVEDSNKFEIDRVKKEEGVDLSGTLANLLEYWRGR